MEPGTILLLILVIAIIVLFVTRPFFGHQHIRSNESGQEISILLAERERLLISLQELDSDQALGKIPAEDYPIQRADLLQKGADILRQIDGLVSIPGKENGGNKTRPNVIASSHVPLSDDLLEELLARRRNLHKEKTAGFCPNCGKPILFSDTFCPSCGHALKNN